MKLLLRKQSVKQSELLFDPRSDEQLTETEIAKISNKIKLKSRHMNAFSAYYANNFPI